MPPKGKQGTKGQKQIKQENASTISFYTSVIAGSSLFYLSVKFLWSSEDFGYSNWALFAFSSVIYAICMKTMHSMAKSNLDLSMPEGMGEHFKDILLVTAACQVLGAFSTYFWLAWLVIPAVALYKLWVGVLSPWFFQEAAEPTEKQRKKMERKMRR